jgi:Protein of unknown function (DUF2750)
MLSENEALKDKYCARQAYHMSIYSRRSQDFRCDFFFRVHKKTRLVFAAEEGGELLYFGYGDGVAIPVWTDPDSAGCATLAQFQEAKFPKFTAAEFFELVRKSVAERNVFVSVMPDVNGYGEIMPFMDFFAELSLSNDSKNESESPLEIGSVVGELMRRVTLTRPKGRIP